MGKKIEECRKSRKLNEKKRIEIGSIEKRRKKFREGIWNKKVKEIKILDDKGW